MDAIAKKHAGLVAGLTKLFDILIAMRYISPVHVICPPHSAGSIATDTFHTLGFESEVIDLIKIIPALRSDVTWGWQQSGIELLPQSKAVTYFADCGDPDWIEDLRWGDNFHSDNHTLLPPWMLRLTSGYVYSGQYGVDLIYNSQDGTIIEWTRIGDVLWDESPSRPAEIVLQELVARFESLEWVPYFDADNDRKEPPARQIVQDPIVTQNKFPGGIRLPLDPAAAIQHLGQELGQESVNSLQHSINRWRVLQKLYRESGWGTKMFDGDAFERKRADFIKALRKLENIQRRARYQLPAQQQMNADGLSTQSVEFWEQWAGENVV